MKLWLADGETTGRIASATDAEVILDVDGAEQATPYEDIKKAVIQVEMNRPVDEEEEEEN